MILTRNLFLVVIICMIFNSCLLGLFEDDITHINSGSNAAKGSIGYSHWNNIFFPIEDTIYWGESLVIKVTADNLHSIEAYINGEQMTSTDEQDHIVLFRNNREAGNYKLKLIHNVHTETGSLASRMGAEYLSFSDEYILNISPDYLPNLKVELVDGTVHVNWSEYNRTDFEQYEIQKKDYTGEIFRTFTISDQKQTKLVDSTYVGGTIEYIFNLKSQSMPTEQTVVFKVNYDPTFELQPIDDNRLMLLWNKPDFYRNIKSYAIKIGNYLPIGEVLGDQYSFEIDAPGYKYGSERKFGIELNAKVNEYARADKQYFEENILLGKKLPYFNSIHYDYKKQLYFLAGFTDKWVSVQNVIYRLDRNLSITDTLKLSIPPNCIALTHTPNMQFFYLFEFDKITKIRADDFSIIDQYPVSQLSYRPYYCATNNDLVLYYDFQTYPITIKIMDFNSKNILYSGASNYLEHLSPDGKYFANGKDFYTFSNQTYKITAELPYEGIKYLQFIEDGKRLIIGMSNLLVVFNCETWSEEASYQFIIPDHALVSYNPSTNVLNVTIENKIELINVVTGERKQIEIARHGLFYGDAVFFNMSYENLTSYGCKIL